MITLEDDFNDRPSNVAVTSDNSIFTVTTLAFPSPPPVYMEKGQLGTNAIIQGANINNNTQPGQSQLAASLSQTVQIARLNAWMMFDRGSVATYTKNIVAATTLTLGSSYIRISGRGNNSVTLRVATSISSVEVMLFDMSKHWLQCEIVETRNSIHLWVKDLSGSILIEEFITVADHTPSSNTTILTNIVAADKSTMVLDNYSLAGAVGTEGLDAVTPPNGFPQPIKWDEPQDSQYDYGLSRGVLYLSDGTGVPWNGLTSFTVDTGQEIPSPLYFDGIKYLDSFVDKDFSATLNAFTYPEEFLPYDGVEEVASGILVDGQTPMRFGMSFQTKTESGYRIHLLYNLLATPSERAHNTLAQNAEVAPFSWTLSAIPSEISGFAPTEYFILDSEDMDPLLLESFEQILYGSAIQSAKLPDISSLADFAVRWNPQLLLPQASGIYTLSPNSFGDITPNETIGYWSIIPSGNLVPESVDGLYILE